MPVNLHPHQLEGIEKLHNGCILYGDVGVGKTITSLGYYFAKVCNGKINVWGSMETPKDVYVITTAKVRDKGSFELQAAQFGVHTDPSISTNGVKITVDSWNNLHKYVEVKDAFFIFDEQRVVGYGAWSRAFIKVAKHNEWILLSATPGDTWLDYIPVFIANGWYKHKTDFLDQHVIWMPRVKYPKVLRYQNVGLLVRRRNQVLVHMPYEKHTVRHAVDIQCDYDQDKFDKVVKKRWHVFEKRPLRDAAELFSVMRKVVNSDASRLEAVGQLLEKHPRLIVFYNFDYELEMLRELGEKIRTDSQRTVANSSSHSTSSEMLRELGEELRNHSSTTSPNGSTSTPPSTDFSSPQTHDPSGLDDWEWLLSPEGMKANESASPKKSSSATSKGSSTSDSTRFIELGSNTSSSFELAERHSQQPKSSRSSEKAAQSGVELNGEGCNISSGISTEETTFAFAEWNGHKHQEIPETDSWLYAVQYRAGAEGWNCIETDAICFFSQTYSFRDWWQAHGRIDRINTPFTDLWYFHLVSSSIIDKAIRKALKAKRSFNERDLSV